MLERAAPDVREHRAAFDCMAAYGIWNKHRRRDTICLAGKSEISVEAALREQNENRLEEAMMKEPLSLKEIHRSVYGQRGKIRQIKKPPSRGLAVKRQLSNTLGAELRGLPQEKGLYSAHIKTIRSTGGFDMG